MIKQMKADIRLVMPQSPNNQANLSRLKILRSSVIAVRMTPQTIEADKKESRQDAVASSSFDLI
jgi:hypothetical protein